MTIVYYIHLIENGSECFCFFFVQATTFTWQAVFADINSQSWDSRVECVLKVDKIAYIYCTFTSHYIIIFLKQNLVGLPPYVTKILAPSANVCKSISGSVRSTYACIHIDKHQQAQIVKVFMCTRTHDCKHSSTADTHRMAACMYTCSLLLWCLWA